MLFKWENENIKETSVRVPDLWFKNRRGYFHITIRAVQICALLGYYSVEW
jgi:hypothetical protein